jgi:predicted RNA binding protein with dsRBD fold (UPF0201 family)
MIQEQKIQIVARMPIFPTEDEKCLINSLQSLFPDMKIEINDEKKILVGNGASIENFSELLKRHRIRDTARKIMLRGIHGDQTKFNLNKQAAVVGKINFVGVREPQVLGEISITITSTNIHELIDEIAESTLYENNETDQNKLDEENE